MAEEWGWKQNRPKWKQLYDALRERIEHGEYAPRNAIPSLVQLQGEFGLAINTIVKAVERLKQEQFVHSEHGLGTFVRPPEDWAPNDDD